MNHGRTHPHDGDCDHRRLSKAVPSRRRDKTQDRQREIGEAHLLLKRTPPDDIIAAIRKEVGHDFHLQVKISAVDHNNAIIFWDRKGNTLPESVRVCRWVEEAGADALHVSGVQTATPVVFSLLNAVVQSKFNEDAANLAAVDPGTFGQVAALADANFVDTTAADAMDALARDPGGVFVGSELADLLALEPGDPVKVLFARGTKQQKLSELKVIGLFERLPGFPEGANVLVNLQRQVRLIPSTDASFFLARTTDGSPVTLERAASALRRFGDGGNTGVSSNTIRAHLHTGLDGSDARVGRNDGDVDRALGDEHVRPEVAVRPGPPAAARERQEVVEPAALLPGVEVAAHQQHGRHAVVGLALDHLQRLDLHLGLGQALGAAGRGLRSWCTSSAAMSTLDVAGSNTSTPKAWAPAKAAAPKKRA